jgi:DNA-binding PadR family transcriptional regulator
MFNDRGQGNWGWNQEWRNFARGWGGSWQRRGRVFERGDLKYVILDLIKEQPRHGYDIIRELEGRFGGFYTPSAGAVYPVLQMLEDMGAVTAAEQDGRKVYTITEEGQRILAERSDTVGAIHDRVRDWFHGQSGAEFREVMHEAGELVSVLSRDGRRLWNDPVRLRRVRDLLARTRDELRDILREESSV